MAENETSSDWVGEDAAVSQPQLANHVDHEVVENESPGDNSPGDEAPDGVSVGDELSINPVTASISAELAACHAELELLGPKLTEALTRDNPHASQEQITALLTGKLHRALELIPLRWKAEKRFKNDCQVLDQLHVKFSKILTDLQAKDVGDQSARIEHFKAKRFINELANSRLPTLEASYRQASDAWYKTGTDPLTEEFMLVSGKIEDLIAMFEYEASIRPILQVVEPATAVTGPSTAPRDRKTILQFDAAKLISSFDGDLTDPDVLLKFSNWKSSWNNLVKEMETLRGFNQAVLFQKLKDCLKGAALTLVDKYSCESNNSYEAAMACLLEKYEDPITLAGSYISSGTSPRDSPAEHADAIRQAFNALTNMRDIFDREGVDLYDFALMRTFITSMRPECQAKWNAYKMRKKLDYNLECEKAAKTGETLPGWKAGMVECREQFDAWLNLQSVQFRQPISAGDQTEDSVSSASNFTLSKVRTGPKKLEPSSGCFLCPGSSTHPLKKCRKGLAMTYPKWKQACLQESRCFKCALPFTPGHRCESVCSICQNRHHPVMCPEHHGRQTRTRERAPPSREPMQPKTQNKRGLEDVRDFSEGPMSKLAKQIIKTVTAQLKNNGSNDDQPKGTNGRGASRKRK